jgi:predicted phosphodiesterase
MRIHLLSDLHFEFQKWRSAWKLDALEADVHVLAGDIGIGLDGILWALNHFKRPVIYVMGNHEFYGQRPMVDLMAKARERTAGTHVHLLENDSVVIDGVRFLGCTLWTDFCLFGQDRQAEVMELAGTVMSDYTNIHVNKKGGRPDPISIFASGMSSRSGDRLTPATSLDFHRASRDFLERELARQPDPDMVGAPWEKTVVVTHHAPSARSLPRGEPGKETDAAYASHLEDLVGQADLWLHGHVHVAREYSVGSGRVVVNCRGYHDHGQEAVKEFDPLRVIDV